MTGGIIICHGQLAFELINTIKKLLGDVKHVHPFSSDFLAPETLQNQVSEAIKQSSLKDIIIMVDLRGGNCWKIGKLLSNEFPELRLLSGVNIPMLISFVSKRGRLSVNELAKVLVSDSNRGIILE